ncbi:hypothetical protein PEL8287_01405 [Roseovarius litorisediminis]|uniref:Uncharacterized protein n=1 Tax=Roseovarius litorisediminis TaxID=1312363 RepID=A0A1Y5S1B6_9RHOB|nr:hypothetical protein PEL8287_01405 [Roseovarius litorisediminis]
MCNRFLSRPLQHITTGTSQPFFPCGRPTERLKLNKDRIWIFNTYSFCDKSQMGWSDPKGLARNLRSVE